MLNVDGWDGWMDGWDGWMVIIGRRYSKSTFSFSANKLVSWHLNIF